MGLHFSQICTATWESTSVRLQLLNHGAAHSALGKRCCPEVFASSKEKKTAVDCQGWWGRTIVFLFYFSTVVAPYRSSERWGHFDLFITLSISVWPHEVPPLLFLCFDCFVPCSNRFSCRLQVDGSNVGANAVLMLLTTSAFSIPFSLQLLSYSVVEKEALALIWALQYCYVY